jgi:methylenetetrahydrofolate dehydrogenase (NADP+)/methenyltetrahydrofolate cyclohydrolase
MILLDGKKVKEEKIKVLCENIKKLPRQLKLVVIQVGNNEASNIYIKNKRKTALDLGCLFVHIKYEDNTDEQTILNKIDELNNDPMVDGILVQSPLPKGFNESLIQNRVLASKDVDGLTDINSGLLFHNKECLISCTPYGILELLNYYNIEIKGKHVVIVGRSNLVGRPLMSLMLNNDATVTICHSKTNNLEDITKTADILVVAIGKPKFITNNMIKDNAVVVDVGINRENDIICGDVDFDSVKDKASYLTPVPGGVGQMTAYELFNNLYIAYEMNNVK